MCLSVVAGRFLKGVPVLGAVCGLLVLPGIAGIAGAEEKAASKQGVEDLAVPREKPVVHLLKPSDLPPPFATPSADNAPKVIPRPEGAMLQLPPGFHVHEWASGLDNPRILTVAPNGDVFVAESHANRVTVLRGMDKTGKVETRSTFAEGLRQPFGIAFYPPGPNPQFVYVGNTDSVVRFPYKSGDLKASGPAEPIVKDLPPGGYNQHWSRNIAFRPDGKKLFVTVGSRQNIGEAEENRAVIREYNPDGTGFRLYATGIRNPVGLAFHPKSGALWAAVNERDGMGDGLVPDYATEVKDGGFYGWPNFYIGPNPDPRVSAEPTLKDKVLVPDVLFDSHVASLGLVFYTGKSFPSTYRNDAFVAFRGSSNRSNRVGYAIVRIPMDKKGHAKGGYEDFLTGWALPDGRVWGRPVGVAVAKDGSLLVTDDGANKIWCITYRK